MWFLDDGSVSTPHNTTSKRQSTKGSGPGRGGVGESQVTREGDCFVQEGVSQPD